MRKKENPPQILAHLVITNPKKPKELKFTHHSC